MKTYLRLLSFAKPFSRFVPLYFLFAILSIFFGLMNFALLIPLMNVLFETVEDEQLNAMLTKPELGFGINYLKEIFYYYFSLIINAYGKIGALKFVCGVIVVSVFFNNFFKYFAQRIIGRVRARVVRNIRKTVFEKITELHLGYFSSKRKGDILSRLSNDVQEIETSVVSTLTVVFRDPATIIGFFILLFIMSFELTIFTLIIMPTTGIIIAEITKRLKKQSVRGQQSLGIILSIIDETLTGLRVIKAFNARQYVMDKFNRQNNRYAGYVKSMAYKRDLASPLSEFMSVTIVAGILLYGGTLVLTKESDLSASEFIAYIILFSQVLVPAKAISSAFSSIQRGLVSGERVLKIVDTNTEIKDKKDAIHLTEFKDSIRFKNVSFAYEKDMVLSNINLVIEKGKNIALAGPSGGGKSTLADLIVRFYDPVEGEVLIDNISLKEYNTDSIRSFMGIVTQESILFNDTIFNNIAFGMPDAAEDEVIKAAKIANAHDFIMQTTFGYQTNIGDRGVKLSGGQKQRISIARAILKNPPIIILDEATSSLDSESEKLVQQALSNLLKNRTSIVIAHRLSTIQHADEIIVIDNGKIVERGAHPELMKTNGLYKKLNLMQSFV
ncbi:MAG: ABC transporter ATP-binding protein [Bacteroidetes bacterium]|nr:ABC transporter ATP-binding protein [Bacteroidota bacterium]